MKKRLCIACDGFPYQDNPEFSFVKELCEEFIRQDIEVSVFAPQSITSILFRGSSKKPTYYSLNNKYGTIHVYRPLSLSFGNRFNKIQYWLNSKVIEFTIRRHRLKFDAFYGHFWHCAYQLFSIAKKQRKELFVASGESHIFLADDYTSDEINVFLKYISKVICVSSKNKNESIQNHFCSSDKTIVIPNAINQTRFYKIKDKNGLRKKFGFPEDSFIIAFLGAYILRKGPNRVSEAIIKTSDPKIKGIFIGKPQDGNSPYSPDDSISLFTGPLPHEQIVEYLNCADVFVLPTLQEGCSNAIIEAMACGLPVISSDRSFNHDILNSGNSILINPEDTDEISNAIMKIKADESYRQILAEGALRTASSLTIKERASKILSVIFKK